MYSERNLRAEALFRGVASAVSAVLLLTTLGGCRGQEKAAEPEGRSDTELPGIRIVEEGGLFRTDPGLRWSALARWAGGSGRTKTETFPIDGHRWRVAWESRDEAVPGRGTLGVFIYDSRDRLQGVAVNRLGEGADTSYFDFGNGSFYLLVNAEGVEWSLEVQVPEEDRQAGGGRDR